MATKRRHRDCIKVLGSKKAKKDNILKLNLINYNSAPSLESMAIVNIAIGLCGQSDIRDAMRQHSLKFDDYGKKYQKNRGTSYDESFHQIEKNILNKLSSLQLPNLLKAKLPYIIRPIQLQMLQWICYDRKNIERMDFVHWSSVGTIDGVKTLENLIQRDQSQSPNSLFKLACEYCLEDSVPSLWEKLPESIQKYDNEEAYKQYDSHMIAFWICVVKNKLSGFCRKIKPYDNKSIYNCKHSIYKNMFALALFEGNIAAVKYFWNALSAKEIIRNLPEWVKKVAHKWKYYDGVYQNTNKYADVLFFLLSKMKDAEQQREVIQQNSDVILYSLFHSWPWQRFLFPTIRVVSNTLDAVVYHQLLLDIVPKIIDGLTTGKFLGELWCESPTNLKRCFINFIINGTGDGFYDGTTIIYCLLTVEDVKTIVKILNDAKAEEKKTIIFSFIKNPCFYELIYEDKLHCFNEFMKESLPLESDIKTLKEKVIQNVGSRLCCHWLLDSNWLVVERFLNWACTSQEQIDNFKMNIMDKIEITYSLLKRGNYEVINQFMNWCFSSEQEINQFKKHFSKSKLEVVDVGEKDWSLFEQFLAWCFVSEQEINDFKLNLLQSSDMRRIVSNNIGFFHNFEFVDKLLNWCCQFTDEIKLFKAKFVLSKKWCFILNRFVDLGALSFTCKTDYSNWELIKQLINLFSPFDKEVMIEMKRNIKRFVDFEYFNMKYNGKLYKLSRKHLFRLLDDTAYDLLMDIESRR